SRKPADLQSGKFLCRDWPHKLDSWEDLMRHQPVFGLLVSALTTALAIFIGGPAPAEEVDFTRDVRPILARHCFKCHGPDDKARQSELRLDVRESALKGGSSGDPGLVPGKPDDSELVRRVLSDDEGEVMPPPSAKLPLTADDKAMLRRWVAEGAKYAPH